MKTVLPTKTEWNKTQRLFNYIWSNNFKPFVFYPYFDYRYLFWPLFYFTAISSW